MPTDSYSREQASCHHRSGAFAHRGHNGRWVPAEPGTTKAPQVGRIVSHSKDRIVCWIATRQNCKHDARRQGKGPCRLPRTATWPAPGERSRAPDGSVQSAVRAGGRAALHGPMSRQICRSTFACRSAVPPAPAFPRRAVLAARCPPPVACRPAASSEASCPSGGCHVICLLLTPARARRCSPFTSAAAGSGPAERRSRTAGLRRGSPTVVRVCAGGGDRAARAGEEISIAAPTTLRL